MMTLNNDHRRGDDPVLSMLDEARSYLDQISATLDEIEAVQKQDDETDG